MKIRSTLRALATCLVVLTMAPLALAQTQPVQRDIANFFDCSPGVNDAVMVTAKDPVDASDCSTGGGTAAPHDCICDADNSSWVVSGAGLGDDLGSHIATQNLSLGGFDILDVGNVGVGTSAPSEELDVSSADETTLRLRATDPGGNPNIMMQAPEANLGFRLEQTTPPRLAIRDFAGTSPVLVYAGSPNNSLVVRESGLVGVGTESPARTLDVNGTGGFTGAVTIGSTLGVTGTSTLAQVNTTGIDVDGWGIDESGTTLQFNDGTANTEMSLSSLGNLSLEGDLFAVDGNFSGTLVVSGTTTLGTVSTGTLSAGSSSITTTGTVSGGTGSFGGIEYGGDWESSGSVNFTVQDTSSANIELTLQSDGDLFIEGFLSEGSSRRTKHSLVTMSPEMAARMALEIPVYEWSRNGSETRHVGPMAEDFFAITGLGSDPERISPGDQAGLNLSAIQWLVEEVKALDARVRELESAGCAMVLER